MNLIECTVIHERFTPKKLKFRNKYFWFEIDTKEIGKLKLPFISSERFNLYAFFYKDHFDLGGNNLHENIQKYLQTQGILSTIKKATIITNLRFLNYIFNSVSFINIELIDGRNYFLTEIGNTFKESKPYLIEVTNNSSNFSFESVKHFYISPFIKLDAILKFQVKQDDKKLQVHIDAFEDDKKTMIAHLIGVKHQFTKKKLFWFTLKYPFVPLYFTFYIHLYAIILWLKKVPYISKTKNPELQTNLFKRN